jgi:hypothetical protein
MKDVYARVMHLRSRACDYGNEVAELLGIQSHEMPAGVFPMIFNELTLGMELLYYYYNIWKRPTSISTQSMEEAKQENAQRVITIERMIFLETMSSIEFCSKGYVKEHPRKIGSFGGRVYLRKIMKRSRDQNVIPDVEFERWEGAIELRNCVVHNNGISEKTAKHIYPCCELIFEDGKMVRGDLMLLPSLIDWMLDSFKCWIVEIDTK